VILVNHGQAPFTVERGMRIAQMIVAPVTRGRWREVETLPTSERGAGGFGSTGVETKR
jgi:dUTP pyrophosphatase